MIFTKYDNITPSDYISNKYHDFVRRIGEPFHKYDGKGHSYREFSCASALFHTQFSKDDVVVDLGGACSYFSVYLSDLVSKVYIVDNFTFEACYPWQSSLKDFPELYNGKVDLIKCNAINMPFDDSTIDHVVTFSVLEHCVDNEDTKCMNEVKRILKYGGTFSGTVDYNPITEYPQPSNPICRAYTYKSFMDRLMVKGFDLAGGDYLKGKAIPETVDYIVDEAYFKMVKK